MRTAESTDRDDQETFVRAFLRDNVRVAGDISFEETLVEPVAFRIALLWRLAIETVEAESPGAYKGDAATVFVTSPDRLARESDGVADGVLRDPEAYAAAIAVIERLADNGLRHDGKLTIRTQPARVACVFACASCDGKGKATCRPCGGSGRVSCSECSASGTKTCTLCSGNGRIAQSSGSSSGATTYRPCTCQNGRVRCSRCSASGRLRCSPCAGSGRVACAPCKATGQRSAVRTLTLVATAHREYRFEAGISLAARETLVRDEPAALPPSVFTGAWESAAPDTAGRSIAFELLASTRFLTTTVRTQSGAFDVRTYGVTLRVADGGGLVEDVLQSDTATLERIVDEPLAALFTSTQGLGRLTAATKTELASRVHAAVLLQHFGAHDGHELVRSVSPAYAETVAHVLARAFSRVVLALSAVPWIACIAVAAIALAIRSGRALDVFSGAAPALAALARTSYAAAALAAAAVALVYLASRVLPILAFSDEAAEPASRCLNAVRDRAIAKTTACAAALAAIVFALFVIA